MTDTELLSTPIGYIERVLGFPEGYGWERTSVAYFERAGWGKKVVRASLLAPNGSGKTSWVEAGLNLWWLGVHPKGRATYTTKDQKQLNEQFIPAVETQVHKLGYTSKRSPYYIVDTPKGGRLVAYVTNDAGRAEGFHGTAESPLLATIGEAKNVEESIFEATDRCTYQGLLYSSSGGMEVGQFYKSHTEHRALFNCVKAGLKDCPHKNQQQIAELIQKYGDNSPYIRSCVYGEFMKQENEDEFAIPHSAIAHALENPPPHRPGHRIGFIDFAEGSAEYVLAIRDGNKTVIALAFRESSKHAACARLMAGCKQNGLTNQQVYGDAADGAAAAILSSMDWPINRVNFGQKAKNEEVYQSWSAEAWIETGIAISRGELIVPADDILIAQMTTRKKEFVGRGKMGVEEKYDMRRRGIESPDRADAYCGANNVYSTAFVAKETVDFTGWRENAENESHEEALAGMGANW